MALELRNSIFFHVGRTAGHWVRKKSQLLSLELQEIGRFHDSPEDVVLTEDQTEKIKFTIIRHPLLWLRSYWCHVQQFGGSLDPNYEYSSFPAFLESMINVFPEGPASSIFNPFINSCDYVGKQEDLIVSFITALTLAKENFSTNLLYEQEIIGAPSPQELMLIAKAPKSLLRKVLMLEKDLCEKYLYTEIPQFLIGNGCPDKSFFVPLSGLRQKKIGQATPYNNKPNFTNSVSFDDAVFLGYPEHYPTNRIILEILDGINLSSKTFLDLNSEDGAFVYYADLKGAKNATGISQTSTLVSKFIQDNFITNTNFQVSSVIDYAVQDRNKYNVVLGRRFLEFTAYPIETLRAIAFLMEDKGTLILELLCSNMHEPEPIMYCPQPAYSPDQSFEISIFNKAGLTATLERFGFSDVAFERSVQIGLPTNSPFNKLCPAVQSSHHNSSSSIERVVVKACYRQALNSETKLRLNYLDNGFTPPSRFNKSNSSDSEESVAKLLLVEKSQRIEKLEKDLNAVTKAWADRERDLKDERNIKEQLLQSNKTMSADLIDLREELIARTVRLETALRKLDL